MNCLKLTADRYEASHGLFATAERLVYSETTSNVYMANLLCIWNMSYILFCLCPWPWVTLCCLSCFKVYHEIMAYTLLLKLNTIVYICSMTLANLAFCLSTFPNDVECRVVSLAQLGWLCDFYVYVFIICCFFVISLKICGMHLLCLALLCSVADL